MFPNTNSILTKIVEIIAKGSSGVILLPASAASDAIAAGTTLYLGLLKLGKNVSLVCSNSIKSECIGSDKIQSSLSVGGDNLTVSFPYSDGAIDKIDYHIQGDKFNLVIAPRQGFAKLNPEQVSYSYSGGSFDFVITIDAPNLNTLGTVYTENQTQFQGKEIINIDRHLTNAFFGTANYVNKISSSTSELVFKLLLEGQIEIDKDMASNLYAGIVSATNAFTSYSVNAETFETIAKLLKLGASKKIQSLRTDQSKSSRSTTAQSVFSAKQPNIERQQVHNISTIESQESQSKEGAQTVQDWLKPNIFKGNGLV